MLSKLSQSSGFTNCASSKKRTKHYFFLDYTESGWDAALRGFYFFTTLDLSYCMVTGKLHRMNPALRRHRLTPFEVSMNSNSCHLDDTMLLKLFRASCIVLTGLQCVVPLFSVCLDDNNVLGIETILKGFCFLLQCIPFTHHHYTPPACSFIHSNTFA